MATWGNHEQSTCGQNYLKCLFALGFQGFLILICVAIYAVLIQSVAISGDAINSIWSIVGYTVLLCFSLFKTSSVPKIRPRSALKEVLYWLLIFPCPVI